jgi:hypothetical protein
VRFEVVEWQTINGEIVALKPWNNQENTRNLSKPTAHTSSQSSLLLRMQESIAGFSRSSILLKGHVQPIFLLRQRGSRLHYTKWQCQERCQKTIKIGFFSEPFLMSGSMVVNENVSNTSQPHDPSTFVTLNLQDFTPKESSPIPSLRKWLPSSLL